MTLIPSFSRQKFSISTPGGWHSDDLCYSSCKWSSTLMLVASTCCVCWMEQNTKCDSSINDTSLQAVQNRYSYAVTMFGSVLVLPCSYCKVTIGQSLNSFFYFNSQKCPELKRKKLPLHSKVSIFTWDKPFLSQFLHL